MVQPCFKRCSCCGSEWTGLTGFLSDPNVTFLGYSPMRHANCDLFYFNHLLCNNTLAFDVSDLKVLRREYGFCDILLDSEDCPGCTYTITEPYEPCNAMCMMRDIRDIIPIILTWHKKNMEQDSFTQ